jgi:hypothetical protein
LFRRTWQSPSNAHAYRLYVVNDPCSIQPLAPPFLAAFAAISEAFDYDRFFEALSSCFCCFVCDSRFVRVSLSSSAKP